MDSKSGPLVLVFVFVATACPSAGSGDEVVDAGSETDATGDGDGESGDGDGDGDGETSDQPLLEVSIVGPGSVFVDPPGETCAGDCSYPLSPGTVVLTATSDPGGSFTGWSGDCAGLDPVTEIELFGVHQCTASFSNLPEGDLAIQIAASKEVVRVPADDAPITDSQSELHLVGEGIVESVTWTVLASDDGSEIASSTEPSYVFTCPKGRRDYDVRATIGDGEVQSTRFERRLLTCVPPRSDAGRTVHSVDIGQASYFQNGEIDGVPVAPGDLVRISGSANGNFAFFNFQGEPGNPIHIINEGLVSNSDASWLLHLINCRHVIVDGLGDDAHAHGIRLSNAVDGGQAVFVRNYTQGSNVNAGSTDIEMFGIEIAQGPDSGFRIWNGGSPEFDADNWTFANLRLHHNRVANVGTEGFYVGYYTDGVDLQPTSYPIVDAKIYRNVVDDSGWDGMQFGSCRSGLEVHDNVVTGSGQADEVNQRSSMQYNSGNGGAVYANLFVGGRGVDLQVGCFGGDTLIYSNVFVGSDAGFYLHAGSSMGPRYFVFANTVVGPNTPGMQVNMNSSPGCAGGTPLSELHYASNLLLGSSGDAWTFAAGNADTTNWTTEPNLAWTGDPGELCIGDPALAPDCADSLALTGEGASLTDLGLSADELPGRHFADVAGRVKAGPSNFGGHQASAN